MVGRGDLAQVPMMILRKKVTMLILSGEFGLLRKLDRVSKKTSRRPPGSP